MEGSTSFNHRENYNDQIINFNDYKKKKTENNENSKIVKFSDYKSSNASNLHTVNLFEWTGRDGRDFTKKDDDLGEVFHNLDKSMRFLHENGYCIDSFNPYDIDVVDGSPNMIRINEFSKIDNQFEKSAYIKEDIFKSSCLQIGLYMHKLSELSDDKIKEHFDDLSAFLPSSDVPYYRGVICRGASVYLCDYTIEKRNRDFASLQKELGDDKSDINNERLPQISDDELTNKDINEILYKDLFVKKKKKVFGEAAFVHVLVFPTIVLTLLILFSILSFIIVLFS